MEDLQIMEMRVPARPHCFSKQTVSTRREGGVLAGDAKLIYLPLDVSAKSLAFKSPFYFFGFNPLQP